MGTMAANWKKRGIRYVAVFWQLFGRASARLNILGMPNIGVSEIKTIGVSHFLCYGTRLIHLCRV